MFQITSLFARIADGMIGAVVPRRTALAACSGTWYQCSGSSCNGWMPRYYRCSYLANCLDTCAPTGYCCAVV